MTRHVVVLLVALVALAADRAASQRVVVVGSSDAAWEALSIGVPDGKSSSSLGLASGPDFLGGEVGITSSGPLVRRRRR
jgi:hypothetical protein